MEIKSFMNRFYFHFCVCTELFTCMILVIFLREALKLLWKTFATWKGKYLKHNVWKWYITIATTLFFYFSSCRKKLRVPRKLQMKGIFNLAICIKSSHLYSNSDREGGRHGQYPIWRISNIPQIVIYAFCHTRGKTLILFRSWLTFTQCKIIFHGYSSVD